MKRDITNYSERTRRSGSRKITRGSAHLLPHGEDGAGGDVAVDVGGAVQGVERHAVLAYTQRQETTW